MYVGQFEGTIEIGEFVVSFDDILKAGETTRAKSQKLPCEDGWSLVEWYARMKLTDLELLAICWHEVAGEDQSNQWEGFPAWSMEERIEMVAKIFKSKSERVREIQADGV